MSEEGIAVHPNKVKAILEAPAPTNAKALSRFRGQVRWHSRMKRYLADVATPLHKTPFQWTDVQKDAHDCLKKILYKVPVVQSQD